MTNEDRKIREYFPLISQDSVAYLDNAATTQKPDCVIRAVRNYYERDNANPLRGLYDLSLRATESYEEARKKVAEFINAPDSSQIVFTRNASESLNLIAYSYGMNFIHEGDEILVSIMEHHSNFLPWQQVAKKTGAKLNFLECDKKGLLTPEMFEKAITPKTKLIAVTQISNLFGRENPIKKFAKIAHKHGAVIVADGAQSVPHIPVDVQNLDVDFLVFSGHKMYSPMGIGVLYGKKDLLEKMPPFLYGGEMIDYVTREGATFAELPHKFEAGTVNAGGAVGLGAAVDFVNAIGFDVIEKRELELTKILMSEMKKIPHVNIIGADEPENHHGIVTFTVDGVHPHDVAAIFNSDNVAVRAGHHCAQPLHQYLGLMSTTRVSLAFYNTEEEVNRFISCLKTVREKMGYGE